MDGDISRIISLIMENPDIIEKIKSLSAKGEESGATLADGKEPQEAPESTPVATYSESEPKLRRRELLCALKPYLSSERAKAIDSMLSIGEIIEIARKK